MKKNFTSSSSLWSCIIALVMMMASQSAWAEYVKLTALSGTGGTGGEGYASLVDAKVGTKMGHSFDPNNPDRKDAYIVVKAAKAVVPEWYFLVTGGDTGTYPSRNWKTWNIYGGNFASDEEAVRGGEGWTLIDERDGDPLPQANSESVNFRFNQADGTTAYQYYWIEITQSVAEADIWLQMGEWGLGTYGDLEQYLEDLSNVQTGTDEPIQYTIIAGDRNNGDGEGLPMLFDGNIGTKWGNGLTEKKFGETTNGAYFIVKTSRAMAPSYYKLVTGTDNASWNHRNWKNWQIYGIAAAEVQNGKPERNSDKWVLLDRKDDVTEDVLPDKNSFTVMFTLSEENATKYQYFKVEIDAIMSGGGYMQMSEFSLGDEYTLAIDKAEIVKTAEKSYNPDLFAEKALIDGFASLIDEVNACTNPMDLSKLNASVDTYINNINASAAGYAELITAVNKANNLLADNNLTAAATAYMQKWTSEAEAIAPNDEFPCGNLTYIKANRQITGAEAKAEASRIDAYLTNNVAIVDDPIYATYEGLAGTGGFGGEEHGMLVDGDRDGTKWCTNSIPGWLIFKASEPIKPTYYGLVTGGDTYSYPDRNWKTWKIWAANFDSDEEATENSDKWVLIDEKTNVGTDVLKTYNKYESYINLSIGCTEKYQYFKIKVEKAGGGLMQMNEFTFYNQGNLNEYREGFMSEFDGYDPAERPAYAEYINNYNKNFKILQEAVSPPDVMKAYNDLKEIQDQLTSSADKYDEYQEVVAELDESMFSDYEQLSAWASGYLNEEVAPNNIYLRGTHDYIINNTPLDNAGLSEEISYIKNMIAAVDPENPLYILLGGHTNSQWGDGFYGHLIDGIAKNTEDVDEEGNPIEIKATKWGGEADANGNTYIIFRTADATNPFFYTLTTGNDTGSYPGRNWGTWYIYGANFEGDGDATKDAEGWVLIDSKENIGQDRLHPVNAQESYFGFSTQTEEKYTYYKIVVTKAYSGSAIQMNEIHFGTEDEFEDIKTQYIDEAYEFDTDVVAEQSLLDKYEEYIEEIQGCVNMEALFVINYNLETLREEINASAKTYEYYAGKVDDAKTYLEENAIDESEAKTALVNYLTTEVEAGELYPNGSAVTILDEHELNDSTLLAEVEFIEELKAAAAAAGYGKGADISSLIVNRSFAKADEENTLDETGASLGKKVEGWNGYIYSNGTNSARTMSAAEFCNEARKFDINQTISNLKNGYYQVKLNAGYRPNNINSYNHTAYAYANDTKTFIPVVREYMTKGEEGAYLTGTADKPIYNCDINGSVENAEIDSVIVGYVIWGVSGSNNAFVNGRYAISMVAKVTDGQLTIGVKNDGSTQGSDWTSAGNFQLRYLGEEEADAADALAEATACNAARFAAMTEVYKPTPASEATGYTAAPGFGADEKATYKANLVPTYEATLAVSEVVASIPETKKAYVSLYDIKNKVFDKWIEVDNDGKMEEAVYALVDAMDEGAYGNAESAKVAKARLVAQFPDYLELKGGKAQNLDAVRDVFAYDLTSKGTHPSVEMTGLYEAIEADEVVLAFEYKAAQDLENGQIMYSTPNLQTKVTEEVPTLAAAADWTGVYFDITSGIEELGFGAANHSIYWDINSKAAKTDVLSLSIRNFRIITKAQALAEGGTILNEKAVKGDVDGNGSVGLGDIEAVLSVMAGDATYEKTADVDGNGSVGLGDIEAILNIMAGN